MGLLNFDTRLFPSEWDQGYAPQEWLRDPVGLLGRLGKGLLSDLSAYAQKQGQAAADTHSVMPEVRDAARQQILDSMTNVGGAGAIKSTVMRPLRMAFPDVYGDPRALVAEAASRVAPEDPLLKRLFNVTREDLFDIAKQGTREGNKPERPFLAAAKAKGASHAEDVTNPRNTNRLVDLIAETRKEPQLFEPMAAWYVMDPAYKRLEQMYGPEAAAQLYTRFNTYTGMASPGSEVLSELNRGTAANWLANEGRFSDFKRYGGVPVPGRGADFPADMVGIIPHPYHSTAHSGPMEKYLTKGEIDMKSAKVPTYIAASGVPETGFQTQWPVGDAHWSRIIGLPDVRGARTAKGEEIIPAAAATVPEMVSLSPWWQTKVAAPSGLESVPAQAIVWGAGSGATGVTSQVGAGKLELLAKQIGAAAKRMNVSPETARDLILSGKAHAGQIDPELLALLAAGALTGAGVASFGEAP